MKSPHMRIEPTTMACLPISTSDGKFTARYTIGGLCGLDFPDAGQGQANRAPENVSKQVRQWHTVTREAVRNALAGKDPGELPPLDMSVGSEFQQQVWEAMRRIPLGEWRSYQDIARTIGRPKAVRAVGGACGANPIPLLVPCHRVLASGGKIGGFSGGLDWKWRLLEREKVPVA